MDTFLFPKPNHKLKTLGNLIQNLNGDFQSTVCTCTCVIFLPHNVSLRDEKSWDSSQQSRACLGGRVTCNPICATVAGVTGLWDETGTGRWPSSTAGTLITKVSGNLRIVWESSELQIIIIATLKVASIFPRLICQALCWVLKSVQFFPPSHRQASS